MEFRELRSMALDKKLLGHHRVWQHGDKDQQQTASSIMGLIPTPKKKIPSPPPNSNKEAPDAATKIRTIADGPPGGLYLPHLRRTNFPAFLLILVCSIALFYAGWNIQSDDTKPILYSLAGMSLSFWVFLSLVYLHRSWEMMKMFGAPMNGSKAVRLFFIPILNALWSFVALFGWARLWNRCVTTHPGLKPASKVWRPCFFLFPILFLASQVVLITHLIMREWPFDTMKQDHQIALGILATTLTVGLVCWFQLSRSINFLARKKS